MEVDSRKLYASQGYASLFTYCVKVLHLSEHAAYLRIDAARVQAVFVARSHCGVSSRYAAVKEPEVNTLISSADAVRTISTLATSSAAFIEINDLAVMAVLSLPCF